VSDHEPGKPVRDQHANQLEYFHSVPHVERGGGLVEDQYAGLLCQGASNPHPLPLATRQGVHPPLSQGFNIAAAKRLERGLPIVKADGRKRPEMGVPTEHYGLSYGEREYHFLPLRDHSDHFRELRPTPLPDRDSIQLGVSLLEREVPQQRSDQRGFAAPVGTDHGNQTPGLQIQGDSVERAGRRARVSNSNVAAGEDHV